MIGCTVKPQVMGMYNSNFKYPEPFKWHYDYKHLIDNHNNRRHVVPSIEGSLKTQQWAMRLFKYL